MGSSGDMSTTDPRLSVRGLRRDDYRALIQSMAAQFKQDDIPSLAAGIAFRIFLSLFPAMFASVAAFSLFTSGQDIVRLLDTVEFLPGQVRDQIEAPLIRFVEQAGGGATLTVLAGVMGGLWAASSAAVLLSRALTRIYGQAETRGFVEYRITGVAIAVAIFIALVALVVLLVAGGALQGLILETLTLASGAERMASVVMTIGRFGFAALALVGLFAFVYWVGPDRASRPRFQWLTPGAVISVLGWITLSALFGLYTRLVGENEVYGALGGVIVLLLWLQVSMIVLLLGAELNSLLRRFTATRIVSGEELGDHGQAGAEAEARRGPVAPRE